MEIDLPLSTLILMQEMFDGAENILEHLCTQSFCLNVVTPKFFMMTTLKN